MSNIFRTISFALFLAFFYSCAQVGTLTGGDKDTIPPVVVFCKPENKSLNFIDKKIIIAFDEIIQPEKLEDIFISSPFLDKKPTFKTKKKKLVITFNEPLKDSTTYFFNFDKGIKDFHEENILNKLEYVFSTTDYLDTMEISGNVIDANSQLPEKDIFVILYKGHTDSVPLKEKPVYLTRTDSSGAFKIDYLKPGKYKLFVLKDADMNYMFNLPNEKIAYYDSLIIPSVVRTMRTDSLKAGTVLHKGKEAGDTLTADTVIVSYKTTYSPSEIKMFSFFEDKQKQFVAKYERTEFGKCYFEFNKPIDSLRIKTEYFDLNSQTSFIQYADTGKTATVWIKDKPNYTRDSVKFEIQFFNTDSLSITKLDTVKLTLPNKKGDTKRDSINANFMEPVKDHDYFKDYKLTAIAPFKDLDSSKIKLYLIVDTLVDDTRTQKMLSSQRRTPDQLFFAFARPLVKNIDIKYLPKGDTLLWYTSTYSKNRDTVFCKINDKSVWYNDTLKLYINYDNDFFLNQTQSFTDSIKFITLKQKLTKIERPAPDTVKITFIKPLANNPNIIIDYLPMKGNFTCKISQNNATIAIQNKTIYQTDTLHIEYKSLDYIDKDNIEIPLEENFIAPYTQKKQAVIKHGRKTKTELYITFKEPLRYAPTVTDVKNKTLETWLDLNETAHKDTFSFTIKQGNIADIDTLKLAIAYDIFNIKDEKTTLSDTLTFFVLKQKRTQKLSNKEESALKEKTLKPVKIELPQDFILKTDSVDQTAIYINSNWIQGKPYKLKADKAFFYDIFDKPSPKKDFDFTVTKKDYYGRIILDINNIKRIEDYDYLSIPKQTLDSVKYSALSEGQIIIQLLNKKNLILKTFIIKNNTEVIFDYLAPEKYYLKLIYDKNKNGKWDTGNYIKHIQPEKVILFPKEITIKSNWDNELDWNIIKEK